MKRSNQIELGEERGERIRGSIVLHLQVSCTCSEMIKIALLLPQQGEAIVGDARVTVVDAERLALRLHNLEVQQLSGGEVALFPKQRCEFVDCDERAWMPIAKRLAVHLQRLA
eukprot:scaffold103639_cov67-Phaeocystis_antarctica.AAC.3